MVLHTVIQRLRRLMQKDGKFDPFISSQKTTALDALPFRH